MLLHPGMCIVPLWFPILSSQPHRVTICGRHIMASVRDKQITEALLTLCLAYFVMKRVRHCWNRGIMAFTYWDMGRAFHEYILRIFRNGWMDCRDAFHAVFCLYCCVGQNIAKYEAYWLIGVTVINPWARTSHSSLQSDILKSTNQNYYVFKKVNKQV